jgi:DnaJ-class molecular chaperone
MKMDWDGLLEAYGVLSDPEARREYDASRNTDVNTFRTVQPSKIRYHLRKYECLNTCETFSFVILKR